MVVVCVEKWCFRAKILSFASLLCAIFATVTCVDDPARICVLFVCGGSDQQKFPIGHIWGCNYAKNGRKIT
ncbi:hypothetical protein CFELI_03420 [Corynebacterium felinum]|uniref:Secreted protein n=1 Tax=Corynebacterium felinum TaxID=131318 RepID=A0ABU2B8P0_9CORY|nr:hypothetical protein [Corynebacterium felinum]WJY94324.1 hypothetical protein CFELI_03420 [Corynebacterium felinum]